MAFREILEHLVTCIDLASDNPAVLEEALAVKAAVGGCASPTDLKDIQAALGRLAGQ